MKKIIVNILVIVTAFLLFAYWYKSSIKDAAFTSASIDENYKIYLITNEKQFQFWDFMNNGVSDMARLLGLTYQWEAPEIQDVKKQIEIFNNAVNSGADAILISVPDADEFVQPVRQAKEKGVKIIYVNTPAKEEGIVTLATNNYEAGIEAGKSMIEELELLGLKKGDIGIISVYENNPTIIQREKGFIDTINADGRYTIADKVYTGGDPKLSEEEATRMIKEYSNLVGLFGTNEGASVGVGNAIKNNNVSIIGIGFDQSDITMKLLLDGALKAVIAQNPYTMGYLGLAETYAALKGFDTGPAYIDTGVSILRKR